VSVTLPRPGVLFTAFEPSGDDHASVVIEQLRARNPYLPIYAWGGPKMEAAGATIIERTVDSAVMGLPGVRKIIEHVRMNRRIEEWLDRTRIAAHVPVDSPDANFPICKMVKERGGRVIHMVAPQLWAWREGRINKLRRLTDLVLCVLPFEESWFLSRRVPARFVGHPLFDHAPDPTELDALVRTWPTGTPNIALMPGSRPGEIDKCWPLLIDAYNRIRKNFPQAMGVVPIVHDGMLDRVHRIAHEHGGWPVNTYTVSGNTDAVIRWCDFALVASGTVTLQIARQRKPMITFYRMAKSMRVPYALLGRRVFKTKFFTLPNLIAGKGVVPELVPHFGDGHALAVGAYRLLRQPGFADAQRVALERIVGQFAGKRCGELAAESIEQMIGLR
jgi:lipid-A-disaccharide synthase